MFALLTDPPKTRSQKWLKCCKKRCGQGILQDVPEFKTQFWKSMKESHKRVFALLRPDKHLKRYENQCKTSVRTPGVSQAVHRLERNILLGDALGLADDSLAFSDRRATLMRSCLECFVTATWQCSISSRVARQAPMNQTISTVLSSVLSPWMLDAGLSAARQGERRIL